MNNTWLTLGKDLVKAVHHKLTSKKLDVISIDNLNPYANHNSSYNSVYDGDKFFGGFGTTQ